MTTINGIDDGESFTVKGAEDEEATTYTMTAVGLIKDGALLTENGVADGAVEVAALGEDENWTAIVSLEDGTLNISESTLADDIESALIVNDITNPTAIYGTLTKTENGYALSTEGASEGTEFDAAIAIDGVEVEFTTDLLNASITSGDATFVVTAAEDGYTVNGNAITGATAITLDSGEIVAEEGVTTTAGDTVFSVSAGGYTISNNDGVTVTGIAAEDATIEVTGTATVEVSALANETTYTVGEQTFAVQSDGDDKPLTFEITDNAVTAVTGLDQDAVLTVSPAEEALSINTVDIDPTGGVINAIGTENGTLAEPLDLGSYYAVLRLHS